MRGVCNIASSLTVAPKTEEPSANAPIVLEFIQSISIPAITEYTPQELFLDNAADANIGSISKDFRDLVLGSVGKRVVGPHCPTTLCCNRLVRGVNDPPILAELSRRFSESLKTSLGAIQHLLVMQRAGGQGYLSTDRKNPVKNVFYSDDFAETLCFISAMFHRPKEKDEGYWCLNAGATDYPREWLIGTHVFHPLGVQTINPTRLVTSTRMPEA